MIDVWSDTPVEYRSKEGDYSIQLQYQLHRDHEWLWKVKMLSFNIYDLQEKGLPYDI